MREELILIEKELEKARLNPLPPSKVTGRCVWCGWLYTDHNTRLDTVGCPGIRHKTWFDHNDEWTVVHLYNTVGLG